MFIGEQVDSHVPSSTTSKVYSANALSHDERFTYLEHLGCHNDWLPSDIALRNHHLLCQEDLACGDLDTEVTTGNHNTVSFSQDLVKVFNTLLVLDLHDDFDVRTIWPQNCTNVFDILATADKGREDHVNAVPDTKKQVLFVLLRERRKVDVGLRKVYTLARREGAVVQGTHTNVGALNTQDEQRQDT
jgi:hypothetical protein